MQRCSQSHGTLNRSTGQKNGHWDSRLPHADCDQFDHNGCRMHLRPLSHELTKFGQKANFSYTQRGAAFRRLSDDSRRRPA
jgi:hypothetical protein